MPEVIEIKLGDEVRDSITGFKGIAVARTLWIQGCDRITIQPKGMNKDGQTFGSETFDDVQVELIKKKIAKKKSLSRSKRGGPRPEPVRRSSV